MCSLVFGAAVIALAQSAVGFTINGKATKLETLEKNGKVFVEVNTFAKALGAQVSFDKASKNFKISTGSTTPATQGTTQLAGDVGEIGKTYTLALGLPDALNFTLTKLEYSAGHFVLEDEDLITRDNKFLILYATVQNPQKSGEVGANKVSLSGVDSNNKTIIPVQNWFDLKTRKATYIGLKPGQKLEIFTYIPLDNGASLPKLIVNNVNKVIRFDLTGKIKGLDSVLADPKTPNIALETLNGTLGEAYPGYHFDFTIDGFAYSDSSTGGVAVPDGGRLLVVNFTIKGTGPKKVGFGGYNMVSTLSDTDHQIINLEALLLASRDAEFNTTLSAGQSSSGRFIYALANAQNAATVDFRFGDNGGSRTVRFDLSSLK